MRKYLCCRECKNVVNTYRDVLCKQEDGQRFILMNTHPKTCDNYSKARIVEDCPSDYHDIQK